MVDMVARVRITAHTGNSLSAFVYQHVEFERKRRTREISVLYALNSIFDGRFDAKIAVYLVANDRVLWEQFAYMQKVEHSKCSTVTVKASSHNAIKSI